MTTTGAPKTNGTSRGFLITLFGIDGLPDVWPTPGKTEADLPEAQVQADFHALFESDPAISYAVWQIEVAPTSGSIHLQGYLHFNAPVRASHIKKLVGHSVHVEMRRGTVDEAIAYCKKTDTRLLGPWEYGTTPRGQGSRTDIEALSLKLKDGLSLSEAVDGNEAAFVKFHRGFAALQAIYQQRRLQCFRKVTTHVKWGKTGVGKTTSVMNKHWPDIYKLSPPQDKTVWWDGYTGQSVILFDDFYGQIKLADMLIYLDGFPVQVPVKGGMVWANWNKVYITSNVHPDDWWSKADIPPGVRAALDRRLTIIEEQTEFEEVTREE